MKVVVGENGSCGNDDDGDDGDGVLQVVVVFDVRQRDHVFHLFLLPLHAVQEVVEFQNSGPMSFPLFQAKILQVRLRPFFDRLLKMLIGAGSD